jgi:hypothetical protein
LLISGKHLKRVGRSAPNPTNILVGGGKVASVSVQGQNGANAPEKLCLALYNGGKLESFQLFDFDAPVCALDYTLENIDETSQIRLFLWNNLEDMIPLSPAFSAFTYHTVRATVQTGKIYRIPLSGGGASTNYKITFDSAFFTVQSSGSGVVTGNGFVTLPQSNGMVNLEALQSGNTEIGILSLN